MKWDDESDIEEYKKKCEEKRRESFDFRNDEGIRQHLEKEDKDANDLCEKHDRYELRGDGERDIEEDKNKYEEKRRESVSFCNTEGGCQLLEKEDKDANDLCEKHDSYKLKWDDERDTEEYEKKCEEQRRESFAFRNTEDIRQRLEREDKDANDLCESMIAMS